jgi:photosystem II stability/assembly factor-like uncharacterized protein
MTPEEREVKRALEARSGEVTPQFRARLSSALSAEGRPSSNFLPALAAVAAVVLVSATVGVLLLARQARNEPPPVAASTPSADATPTPTPTSSLVPGVLIAPPVPIALPANAQLSAPSSSVVWALIVDQYLYRSDDRGGTWEQMPLPPSRAFCPKAPAPCPFPGQPEISFVSAQEGWLSISGASQTQTVTLWHTTDAGMTWQDLAPTGIGDGKGANGLSFLDSNQGFIDIWNPNHASVIYRTTDGGRTWTASQPLTPPFKTVCVDCIAMHAGSVQGFASTLLVPTWQDFGSTAKYVFKSTDGGATWTYLASAKDPGNNIDFVTATRWLQLIGPGQSVETIDAGANWHRYASDYSQAAPIAADFIFGDSLTGYSTVRGGIWRTEDGGLHWQIIQTPGTLIKPIA